MQCIARGSDYLIVRIAEKQVGEQDAIISSYQSNYLLNQVNYNLNDYVYPIVKINPNFTGTLNITNVSDDNRDINIDVYQDNEITIDCAKLQIKDASGLVDMYDLGFTSLDYIYWIRLVNGENIFSITGGDVDITFEYRECYKIGIFN